MEYSLKRKKIRDTLVKKCLTDLRKSKLPDYTLGFLLKSIHFHTPWYFLLLFLLLPKPLALLATIPLIIAFSTFIYLQGCFLTIVEKKLLKDDDKINIIDPFIQILGDEINSKTRYWYTLAISGLYCIFVLLLLYCRGCFKWETFHNFKIDFLLEHE
jgi:phosphoglycerol transferase MdoB-like AlkP superfamily enzyme